MRGEYKSDSLRSRESSELPPYARRILPGCILTVKHHGTTSVCAENTGGGFFHSFFLGNYLRMRGECHKYSHGALRLGELPPHARRILFSAYRSHLEKGTTSAYAENTPFHTIGIRVTRNYLRVRGEYISPLDSTGIFGELPPRARRIPVFPNHLASSLGTTSACAENTTANTIKPTQRRNYLRVRGEYALLRSSDRVYSELPPRARRILFLKHFIINRNGTTSACAENTAMIVWWIQSKRNYLRVRGEYPRR